MIRMENTARGDAGPPGVRAVVARYLEAWGAADLDAVMALHAPTSSFTLHHGNERYVGASAVRAAFDGLLGRWPGFALEQRNLIAGPRHWILDWTMVWANGSQALHLPCLDVVVLDDVGLIATKDTWVDPPGATAPWPPVDEGRAA
jgi:hypothetical protein